MSPNAMYSPNAKNYPTSVLIFLFRTFPLHIAVSLAYSCIISRFISLTACGLALIIVLHKMRDFCIGFLNA